MSQKLFRKVNDEEIYCKKFKVLKRSRTYESTNAQINDFTNALELCKDFIHQIYEECIEPIHPTHQKVAAVIEHTSIGPISFPMLYKHQLTEEMIMDRLADVIQSKKKDPSYTAEPIQKLKFRTLIIDIDKGGARYKSSLREFETVEKKSKTKKVKDHITLEYGKKKLDKLVNYMFKKSSPASKSLIQIYSNDNFCLLRAILVGKAVFENDKNAIHYGNGTDSEFNKLVKSITQQLGITGESGLEEIKLIENYLHNQFDIYIIDQQYKLNHRACYRTNQGKHFNKFIYLFYHEQHFSVICSMNAWLERSYYCDPCKVAYSNLLEHSYCRHICTACLKQNCQKQNEIKCQKCGLQTRNTICQDIHSAMVCAKMIKCHICGISTHEKKASTHVCSKGEKYCKNCKKVVPIDHICFIKAESKPPKQFNGYVFFDFEAYAESSTKKHIVNLAVAQYICIECLDLQKNERCAECQKVHIFDSIEAYIEWAKTLSKTIHIAHNLKGYDGHFIVNWLISNLLPTDSVPIPLVVGNKFLSINFNGILWLDSASFIPMPLSSFPKSFGINELKKGFFPHAFNIPENQSYVGPYPEKAFYQPEHFSIEKKIEFDQFYTETLGKIFDFKKEFLDYCKSDVKLLTEGCLSFRKIMMTICKFDPFSTSQTLASYCNHVFRELFLIKDSIMVLNDNQKHEKTSRKCFLWLQFTAEKNNIYIEHAKNSKEKTCGQYKLDGFCKEIGKIFEFNGCYWHGCVQCYKPETFNAHKQQSMHVIHMMHKCRIDYIRKATNMEIVEIWEHEWDDLCENDKSLKNWLKQQDSVEPLSPRDALFGGRTEALRLHYACKENEKIRYIDYTSLYPYVQKYGKFPRGAYKKITENFEDFSSYYGIVKCKILTPRGLYSGFARERKKTFIWFM